MKTDLYKFIDEALEEWKFLKSGDFEEFIAKLVLATLENQETFKKEAKEILSKPKFTIESNIKSFFKCCEPINGEKLRLLCADLILNTLNSNDIINEALKIKEKYE